MYGIVKMIVKETTKNSVEDFEVRFYDLNYDLKDNKQKAKYYEICAKQVKENFAVWFSTKIVSTLN